jgi:hypothetical protein
VEVPFGDFYALAHARVRELKSYFVTVNPGMGPTHGLNAYFPMPFSRSARITVENRADTNLGGLLSALWFHVNYEVYDEPPPDGTLRFHAQYRQERPTTAIGDQRNVTLHGGVNLDGAENYVALDATGAGQMVGLVLQVNNIAGGWYGEGDDMVFIDGDVWPPSIHGTGSEEIFGGGACPNREYWGPYTGFHLVESPTFEGLVGMYRWYVHDPLRFQSSLRWTIEHGHANNFANEYSSVAYWYQSEPHIAFPALPSRDELRPPLGPDYGEAREALFNALRTELASRRPGVLEDFSAIGEVFYEGQFRKTLDMIAGRST